MTTDSSEFAKRKAPVSATGAHWLSGGFNVGSDYHTCYRVVKLFSKLGEEIHDSADVGKVEVWLGGRGGRTLGADEDGFHAGLLGAEDVGDRIVADVDRLRRAGVEGIEDVLEDLRRRLAYANLIAESEDVEVVEDAPGSEEAADGSAGRYAGVADDADAVAALVDRFEGGGQAGHEQRRLDEDRIDVGRRQLGLRFRGERAGDGVSLEAEQ